MTVVADTRRLTLAPRVRRRARYWLVHTIYETPDSLRSWEDLQRHEHLDLPHLTVAQLERERDQARLRATVEPEPHDEWLVERRQRIAAELARRNQGGRHGR